jgi:hypothetical protein
LGDRLLLALVNLWVYLRHLRHIRRFQWIVGYTPNTALPRRYHEKMLWRKVFDRNPRFIEFSDKLRCKAYALARCPDLAQPATLWQGELTAEIPADLMTGPTYLKANHGWKLNRRLDAGSRPDDIPPELGQHWLSRQHGEKRFEWAYLQVAPRLYLEEALQSTDAEPLVDLSVHAVAGAGEQSRMLTTGKREKRSLWIIPRPAAWPSRSPAHSASVATWTTRASTFWW